MEKNSKLYSEMCPSFPGSVSRELEEVSANYILL